MASATLEILQAVQTAVSAYDVYYQVAPESASLPYIALDLNNFNTQHSIDSNCGFQEFRLTFNIYSEYNNGGSEYDEGSTPT